MTLVLFIYFCQYGQRYFNILDCTYKYLLLWLMHFSRLWCLSLSSKTKSFTLKLYLYINLYFFLIIILLLLSFVQLMLPYFSGRAFIYSPVVPGAKFDSGTEWWVYRKNTSASACNSWGWSKHGYDLSQSHRRLSAHHQFSSLVLKTLLQWIDILSNRLSVKQA